MNYKISLEKVTEKSISMISDLDRAMKRDDKIICTF